MPFCFILIQSYHLARFTSPSPSSTPSPPNFSHIPTLTFYIHLPSAVLPPGTSFLSELRDAITITWPYTFPQYLDLYFATMRGQPPAHRTTNEVPKATKRPEHRSGAQGTHIKTSVSSNTCRDYPNQHPLHPSHATKHHKHPVQSPPPPPPLPEQHLVQHPSLPRSLRSYAFRARHSSLHSLIQRARRTTKMQETTNTSRREGIDATVVS